MTPLCAADPGQDNPCFGFEYTDGYICLSFIIAFTITYGKNEMEPFKWSRIKNGENHIMQKIHEIFFSPNGTTKQIADWTGESFPEEKICYDLLAKPVTAELNIAQEDTAIISMPVYGGRIPGICVPLLRKFKGNQTPAILEVVYGNRAYDDALLELKELMEENGFLVIGAGAFIAQHSIFPKVGEGRPNQKDRKKVEVFACKCRSILQNPEHWPAQEITVPGCHDYRKSGSVPFTPDGTSKCTFCGKCVEICPTHSIRREEPRKTQTDTCISCGACIHICPEEARGFHGMAYQLARTTFQNKYSEELEPEVFFRK